MVKLEARAKLPTKFGNFEVLAFSDEDCKEHAALVKGDISSGHALVRIHSECLTGDALGSRKCDCRQQLELSLQKISQSQAGVLLYLRQEGRGIGLVNKIRAYELQDKGADTVEANTMLGFRDDERDYEIAAKMLRQIGIKSVDLLTNNPRKIDSLEKNGIKVKNRVPLIIEPNGMNEGYLRTKKEKLGHQL